ncbi:MAG TPA: hypothetical protein VFR07_04605 [Mycobacteriales bacterium]|jgi:hypothetical protein|nr:hypothetical protein [Mycobacteriales bacterium]
MSLLPSRLPVLARPRRAAADIAVHVEWDDAAPDPGELLAWVRRCRAQGVRVHVDLVSGAAVAHAVLLGLSATSMALHTPAVLLPPAAGSTAALCHQLHLTGAGARVVARARRGSTPFSPALPVERGRVRR